MTTVKYLVLRKKRFHNLHENDIGVISKLDLISKFDLVSKFDLISKLSLNSIRYG